MNVKKMYLTDAMRLSRLFSQIASYGSILDNRPQPSIKSPDLRQNSPEVQVTSGQKNHIANDCLKHLLKKTNRF